MSIEEQIKVEVADFVYSSVPFGPFVMHLKVPDSLVDFLKTEGDKLTDLSVREKLAGHLEKEHRYPIDIQEKFIKMTASIFDGYRESHLKYFQLDNVIKQYGHDYGTFKPTMVLENLWVNYMRENEYNPLHTHSGDLSFIIYLDVPDMSVELKNHVANSPPPGWVMFQNELMGNEPTWKIIRQSSPPKTGHMFIFPAGLHHQVSPYKTPGTRISVSGNLKYTNRDKWPGYFF